MDKQAEISKLEAEKENEYTSRFSSDMKMYVDYPMYPVYEEEINKPVPVFVNASKELEWRFDITEDDDIKVPTWEESQSKLMSYLENNLDNENFQPE